MKSTTVLWALTLLVIVAACDKDKELTINGIWESENGSLVKINGSEGVYVQIASTTAWPDAIEKGFVKIGDLALRNLNKTDNLTWEGQGMVVRFNSYAPNIAIGVAWADLTITMNANGQSFQEHGTYGVSTYVTTWTRK